MLKKKKLKQKEKEENLSREYDNLMKNKSSDMAIENYIRILKTQYDEKTLNQELLEEDGYLKTLYLALKYEFHYCRSKMYEAQEEADDLKIRVYSEYIENYSKFLYIISSLIVLEKGVEARQNRCIVLENLLPTKEVEKQKIKYLNQEIELDYNFALCFKSF